MPKEKTKTELTLAWIEGCLKDIDDQTAAANDQTTATMLDQFDAIVAFRKAVIALVGEKGSRLTALHTRWNEKIIPERFEDEEISSMTREKDGRKYRVQVAQKLNTAFIAQDDGTPVEFTAICATSRDDHIVHAVASPADKLCRDALKIEICNEYEDCRVEEITAYGREAGMLWLRVNGFDSLIKETVNAQTLNSAARQEIEEGRELPEKLFRQHYFKTASVVKA